MMASDTPVSDKSGIGALNAGELECLRLVTKLQSSKQIARILQISPHTVDQRMRVACRKVGAINRNEAAIMLAEHEAINGPVPISIPIADTPANRPSFPQISAGERPDEAYMIQPSGSVSVKSVAARQGWIARFGLPFPNSGRTSNDLTFGQRMAWALVIAACSILVFGMLLAALTALGQFV